MENWQGSPEAYLLEGRAVLRDFQVQAEGAGMRISGRIWSDFETVDAKGTIARRVGQVLGLSIEVSLHEINSEHDDRLGALVPSQRATCEVNQTERTNEVELGVAIFSLPLLSKPLPPGLYRLACKLEFAKQSRECKEALMWVRNLYGITPNYDQSGHPTGEVRDIYGSRDHKDFWKEITENEVCRSQGTLFLGDSLINGVPTFTSSNVLCRDASFDLYVNLAALEIQRAHLDDQHVLDKQDAGRDPKAWKRVQESYEKSVRQLDMLVARAGGWMNEQERFSYALTLAAAKYMLLSIAEFEDDLTLKYWVALDTFHYNFHTVNKLGYVSSVAIDKGDNTRDRMEREKKLQALTDPLARRARDARRDEAFQYIPEPTKMAAYEYYRLAEETPYFDSESVTRRLGNEVQLAPEKWREFRIAFLMSFRKKSAASMAALDLSERYAIQKWAEVYKQLVEVRDNIIVHAYCYEHYLRMIHVEKEIGKGGDKNLRAEADKQIVNEWEAEAGDLIEQMKPLFTMAKGPPSAVYARWESASKQARRLLDMPDFAYRYMLSIQKNPVPPPRRYK